MSVWTVNNIQNFIQIYQEMCQLNLIEWEMLTQLLNSFIFIENNNEKINQTGPLPIKTINLQMVEKNSEDHSKNIFLIWNGNGQLGQGKQCLP